MVQQLVTSVVTIWLVIAFAEASKFYQVVNNKLCDDVQNGAAKFSNMNIVGKSQEITISGTVEAIRNVQPPVQFSLSVNRCEMNQSNCEHFDTITFDDVCTLYNEHHFTQAHMDFFTPPLSCPLAVGKYVAKDAVLDMTIFEGFPIGDAHWQAEMRLIDGLNKTAVCIWSEVTIIEKDM